MNRRPALLLLLVLLASALLIIAACSPTLVSTTPKLPPGFMAAEIPSGDLSAYLYLSQDDPVTMPLERFGEAALAAGNPRFTTIPEALEIDRLALAVGPDLDSYSGAIEFTHDLQAEMAEDVVSDRSEVTSWREGKEMFLVRGTGGWADALESALRSGDSERFEDAYPDMWELMRLLPEAPPATPVAAGFVRVNQDILDSLTARAGVELGGLSQAFGAINVDNIVFAAYANDPLALPAEIEPDYFQEAGVGAIFVARSTYPGFVLSFFLGTFADRVGLEKETLSGGQEVLSKELANAHLFVKPLGNTLFLSLAPTREKAEALIASVLELQED